MKEITRDEWLEALEAAYPRQAEGVATRDVAAKLGCCVMNAMRTMKKAGWVYAGKKLMPKITGVMYPVDVYRPPEKKKR